MRRNSLHFVSFRSVMRLWRRTFHLLPNSDSTWRHFLHSLRAERITIGAAKCSLVAWLESLNHSSRTNDCILRQNNTTNILLLYSSLQSTTSSYLIKRAWVIMHTPAASNTGTRGAGPSKSVHCMPLWKLVQQSTKSHPRYLRSMENTKTGCCSLQ